MKTKMLPKLLALFVAFTATGAASANEILYLEDFSNLGGFTRPATAVGWKAFRDDGNSNRFNHLAELADPDGVQLALAEGDPEIAAAFNVLKAQAPNLLARVPQPPGVFDVPGAYIDNEAHRAGFLLLDPGQAQ